MAEQFPESGARRGRRSTEIEVALEAEEDDYTPTETGMTLLNEGDSVMCRMTLAHETAAGDGWFSWGVTTTLRPGETEEEAAYRVMSAATSRTYELIDEVTDTVEKAVQEQREARRSRRIPR